MLKRKKDDMCGARQAGPPCRGRLIEERFAEKRPGSWIPDSQGARLGLTCRRCGQAHGWVS